MLLKYAHTGLQLYFLGFLFAGINILLVAYFSATANARPAIIGSLLRGVILFRTKVLNKETLEPISKFVIKMALPVMIFINIIDGVNKEILSGLCAGSYSM